MNANARLAVGGAVAGFLALLAVVGVGLLLNDAGVVSTDIGPLVQVACIVDGLVFIAIFFGGRSYLGIETTE